MTTALFDRDLIVARRRRVAASGMEAGFLIDRAVDETVERLMATTRSFALGLDIGTPSARMAEALVASGRVSRVVRIDRLAADTDCGFATIVGDEEALPIAAGAADLAVSVLALHTANDLPGVLIQIRRALKPDGLFLAVLFGGDTLIELRTALAEAEIEMRGGAAPRVAPFADIRDLGALMQRAGFALPVADQERLTVRYPTALELMRELRAMAATNVLNERERRPLRRDVLFRAAAIYAERFGDPDGRVRATFDIVSLSGWVPHESQQQPLRPGSARQRLADVLGTREHSAGEKPEG